MVSISQDPYRDWKSYHLETVLLNVLDSGALVAITTTPVDPGSYQVSEMPALSTAVTAGSRPLTARKDEQAQTISEWL